jgi:hypothetical protein
MAGEEGRPILIRISEMSNGEGGGRKRKKEERKNKRIS